MPHLTVHALEGDLAGREAALVGSLTDAAASVFGEQSRARTTVELVAAPAGRTGVGGLPSVGERGTRSLGPGGSGRPWDAPGLAR